MVCGEAQELMALSSELKTVKAAFHMQASEQDALRSLAQVT